MESLEAELKVVENSIKAAKGFKVTKEQILEYMDNLTKDKDTNPNFKHELLLSIVEYVSVDNDKIIVVCKNNEKANPIFTDKKFAISSLGDTKEAIYELKVKRDYFIVVVNRKVA